MMERLQNRAFLIENLCFLYRLIAASETLLKLAITKSSGPLRAFYVHHLDDERGHQRMLALDLAQIGVTNIPRSFLAAQLAGSQYYFLRHDNPALLLGYMHCLEKSAPSPDAVTRIERAHGNTLACVRHHSEHDPQHVIEIDEQIAAQDQGVRDLIAWNEACTHQSLVGIFDCMWRQIQELERKSA
jgi:hypothetical protein